MKKEWARYLKISLGFVYFVFCAMDVRAESKALAVSKDKAQTVSKPQTSSFSPYSFRPLLIQGKKRLIQKTKDMKVESGNIAESQLFFLEIDFRKRIFEAEAIE